MRYNKHSSRIGFNLQAEGHGGVMTFKEWFDILPEPQKGEAIRNVIIQRGVDTLNQKHYEVFDLEQAIGKAFVWGATSQGYEYWSKTSARYKGVEK